MRPLVTLSVLVLCGCTGPSDGQQASGQGTPAAATTAHSMEVANRCGGFGPAQAAELLGVAAADLEPRLDQVTPTTRGCTFSHRGDRTRQVSFSITREDSVDDARQSFASYRDTVTIGSQAREAAMKDKPSEGAYVDILGVGDEAVWSHTNEALNVRVGNLTIMVLRPDEKKQQVAVARKVIESLR